MQNLPLIKLTVEGMKHEIIHALSGYEKDLQQAIKTGVEKAVSNFNFEKLVTDLVQLELRKTVEESVRWAVSAAASQIAIKAADEAVKGLLKS